MSEWTQAQIERCNQIRAISRGKTTQPYKYLQRSNKVWYRCGNCHHNVNPQDKICKYCEITLDWQN